MGDRKMIYPYTFTAKLVSFPYKFYYNSSPYYKCWVWGIALVAPFFWKIQTLANSPENYAKFEAYLKKQEEEHKAHLEHLL